MRPIRQRQLIATSIFVLLGLLSSSGCGDGRFKRYPVTGSVLVDGQPAEGAFVYFCPVSGTDEVMAKRPFGRTDSQGQYELTTFEGNDGAPAGQYRVVIQWPSEENAVDERSGRAKMGPDRLQGKYYKLADSTITASVEERSNEIPPFELATP
jgi:hypothetical protein